MKLKYTPENITELADNQVFTYGSNRAWRHGAGAARVALKKFGAVYGEGPFRGQSYGISTKDENIQTLPLSEIKKHIDEFVSFAVTRPDLEFLVTKVGMGLSGYKIEDIAPLFYEYRWIENLIFPIEFWEAGRESLDSDKTIEEFEVVIDDKNNKIADLEYRLNKETEILKQKLRYLFYFRFPAGHKFCDDLYDLDIETWKEIHTILEKNKEFRDGE